jgi:hypothetical protein
MRHLGVLGSAVKAQKHPFADSCLAFLRIEMAARVIKDIYRRHLRETMQTLKVPMQEPYVKIDYFNF